MGPIRERSAAAHSASAQSDVVSVGTIVIVISEQLGNDAFDTDICAGLIQWVASQPVAEHGGGDDL